MLRARSRQGGTWATVLALASAVVAVSCHYPPPPSPPPRPGANPQRTVPPPVERVELARGAWITSEPDVRVRVAGDVSEVTFEADASLVLSPTRRDGARRGSARAFRSPVRLTREDGRWLVRSGSGDFTWAAPWLRVEASGGEAMRFNNTAYPGAMVLVPLAYRGNETHTFDAVNFVPIEAYLPGVVEREMWPNWHDAAFEAQAVAARSYALFEQRLNRNRHYDLTSTTASQVYGGAAESERVIDAVRRTRGQVMLYQGYVLPTFYSSCCGGTSQDASMAFPHLGRGVAMTPLRSVAGRQWCAESPHHRWGPVVRDAGALAQRLRAWGRVNDHAIAQLEGLRRIDMTDRTPAGRPTAFTVTDARGYRYTLPAEHFRFACNHPVEGLPELDREQTLRSSHVRASVHGTRVRFSDGRGFGHGAGMCQWGAQGMADRGHDAHAILSEFYPDAQLRRIYD